jgi:hypothetical protein
VFADHRGWKRLAGRPVNNFKASTIHQALNFLDPSIVPCRGIRTSYSISLILWINQLLFEAGRKTNIRLDYKTLKSRQILKLDMYQANSNIIE